LANLLPFARLKTRGGTLTNHEFLRDLAESYLENAGGETSPVEKETQHLATLALFAFKEHVALTKRIYGEVNS
jgi:hypothetical protein